MKWWFSSWNLFLFSLSKVCRISSADCFYSGFTASQSPQLRLRSIVGYTLPELFSFCFPFASKVFLSVMHWKAFLKNIFNLCPPSFYCLLHFVFFSVFALTSPRKINLSLYLIWTLVSRFAGVFCKSFLPPHYNWKVTSRLLGYFTKILQKNCREFFSTIAYKKEVRYYSNFLLLFLVILSNHFWHIGLTFNT